MFVNIPDIRNNDLQSLFLNREWGWGDGTAKSRFKEGIIMETGAKQELEIYEKMAALCSKSEQCTSDIRKKIRSLEANSMTEDNIVSRLEQENFLNDARYALTYVSEKFRINKWGKVKIRYYLKMKGIEEKLIESALNSIDHDDYVALLVKIMKEKARSTKKGEKFERMGQIIRFAQGRGFEPELIHRHLREVIS